MEVGAVATPIPGTETHCPLAGRSILPSPVLWDPHDTHLAVHFLQLLLADRRLALFHAPQKELHV